METTTYVTHVGLTLALIHDDFGWSVTLTGDRTKVICDHHTEVFAREVFERELNHYEERKKQESGDSNSL